ncbi:hypothetical protein ABMA27_004682 [Loxostege sticticalis]|uniref:Uncharacterized protein n=1 Tax=Loxostege sticticalis TaxID=481309 RepID=A0ABR3HKD6_LOXSC
MIQLRDKEFDDEDKVLLKNIRQRMEGHVDFPSSSEPEMDRHFQDKAEYFTKIMEMMVMEDEEEVGNNATRGQPKGPPIKDQDLDMKAGQNITDDFRRAGIPVDMLSGRRYAYWRFPKVPSPKEEKERAMEMMQHSIYSTQYRMRHLQSIVDRYSGNLHYRVAYIYCRLEVLLKEMDVMYTYIHKNNLRMNAHVTMIYYTYFMKKNIDVTYIVEYMIRIHTAFMESKKKVHVVRKVEANITDDADHAGNDTETTETPEMPETI